jgi:hypothetical protein
MQAYLDTRDPEVTNSWDIPYEVINTDPIQLSNMQAYLDTRDPEVTNSWDIPYEVINTGNRFVIDSFIEGSFSSMFPDAVFVKDLLDGADDSRMGDASFANVVAAAHQAMDANKRSSRRFVREMRSNPTNGRMGNRGGWVKCTYNGSSTTDTCCGSRRKQHAGMVRKYDTRDHNSVHHTNKEDLHYRCSVPNCTFACGLKRAFVAHSKIHDINREKFKCNECEDLLTTKGNLKEHIKTHVTDREKFKCNECEDLLTTKGSLKEHIKTHVTDREKFKCNECGDLLSTKGNLKEHIKIHEPKQKHRKISSSGYRGVKKRKSGRFSAYISTNRKKKSLGTFDTAIKAALAYDQALTKKGKSLYNRFSLNFPDGIPMLPIKLGKRKRHT